MALQGLCLWQGGPGGQSPSREAGVLLLGRSKWEQLLVPQSLLGAAHCSVPGGSLWLVGVFQERASGLSSPVALSVCCCSPGWLQQPAHRLAFLLLLGGQERQQAVARGPGRGVCLLWESGLPGEGAGSLS